MPAENVRDGRGIHRSTLLRAGRDRERVESNPKRRMAFGIRGVHQGVAGQEAFCNFRMPNGLGRLDNRASLAVVSRHFAVFHKTLFLEGGILMQKLFYLAAAILVLLGISAGAFHLSAKANPAADDNAAIKALYDEFNDAFNKKDVNGIMAVYAQGVFVFDAVPPREYPTWDAYKKDWEGLFNITVVGPVAYTRSIDDGTFTRKDGSKTRLVVRTTDVLRKSNGKWRIVQEHVSFPVDPTTGKADLLSKP